MTQIEERIHQIFYPAPGLILQVQTGSYHWRRNYQKLIEQLTRLQKLLSLLQLLFRFWRPKKQSDKI